MAVFGFCAVVLDNNCTAPHNVEGASRTLGECYACGLPVCRSCSTIRLYCGERHRICATCECERFEDGEARVLLRMYHRAGYPNVRLADCRAELVNPRAL